MAVSRYTLLVTFVLLGCLTVQPATADRAGLSDGAGAVETTLTHVRHAGDVPFSASGRTTSMTATPHDETATPETAGHDGDDHAHDATETAPRETDENSSAGAHADGGDHGHSSGHDSGRHERAGPLHLLMEGLQISLACAAVGSVVLAGRIYGGEIGRASA